MKQAKGYNKDSVNSIKQLQIADLSERGIRREIAEKFNIRMSVSEDDGISPTALYFPYYDKRGKLCGWKMRDLSKHKNDDFHFTTIGKVGVECKLFGQLEAEKVERRRQKLIYVEGELDVLAVYQMAIDNVKNTKYEGLEPFVVSLNCGTANCEDATVHNQEFIESFSSVVLAFDGDEATDKEKKKNILRGKEATEGVASVLLGHNLQTVEYPEGCKDPNDCILDGKEEEFYNNLMFNTSKYTVEKVVTASQMDFNELIQEREEGVNIPTMPLLMEKIHGFRKGELTVVTALSGVGKTTITREFAFQLAMQGHRIGMIFLEEDEKETEQGLMARYLEISFNKFKFNPKKYASMDKLREAYDWTCEDDRFVFLDHFGSLQVDKLMEKVKYLHKLNKVDYIFLDHLSMVTSGSRSQDERKDIEALMTDLAAYVAGNDVGVVAVCHLNRNAADEIRGISRLTEPVWVCVKKEDLKGASGLEQMSWVIIGVDMEIMPDRTRGRVRLTALKNRPWGLLGNADVLKMNDETGILEDASDEVFENDYSTDEGSGDIFEPSDENGVKDDSDSHYQSGSHHEPDPDENPFEDWE